uniref:C-type lectin domain-containing protein n=1 Tax=Seriola lalandi dorsalis TaxID=1841481 RepID=A0A3B4WZX6_SERLL
SSFSFASSFSLISASKLSHEKYLIGFPCNDKTKTFYVYVNMPKTWVEAQSYCREMFNDLATVTNRDFNNKLMSVIQGHGRFVWIGLHDERTKWEWSLNNRPNNWKLRKQCTVITKNGYWLDISCMERLPFLSSFLRLSYKPLRSSTLCFTK